MLSGVKKSLIAQIVRSGLVAISGLLFFTRPAASWAGSMIAADFESANDNTSTVVVNAHATEGASAVQTISNDGTIDTYILCWH